jgi:hypothetical protein
VATAFETANVDESTTVDPFFRMTTAVTEWLPSGSFRLSYGCAEPLAAVPARSKGPQLSTLNGWRFLAVSSM